MTMTDNCRNLNDLLWCLKYVNSRDTDLDAPPFKLRFKIDGRTFDGSLLVEYKDGDNNVTLTPNLLVEPMEYKEQQS